MRSLRAAVTSCVVVALAYAALSAPTISAPPVDPRSGAAPAGAPVLQNAVRQDRKAPWGLEPGQRCMECHEKVANEARIHNPVKSERCDLCHLTPDPRRHVFTLPADMGATCSECHPLPMRNTTHEPVRKGECLSCHKPHQSDQRFLFRAKSEGELCAKCHQAQTGTGKKHIHGPVALGLCSVCHSAHSSHSPHLLKTETNENCLFCHKEFRKRLTAPHLTHGPVARDCALCHDPHASDHEYQLLSDQKSLCKSCHKPFTESLDSVAVAHAALDDEKGCLRCHDAHSSLRPKLLEKPVGELCLSCHDGHQQRADGTTLAGLGEKLRSSTYLHGPVRDGNCAACHAPHGSQVSSLLRHPYPPAFYSPYDAENYGLCFGCHDESAFLLPLTSTHTKFREGDMNLHFVHVNRKDKGRTCRACHDTHSSNLPFHIKESVPFGGWDIPINFQVTPTGGSCAPGCHESRAYKNRLPGDPRDMTGTNAAGRPARPGK